VNATCVVSACPLMPAASQHLEGAARCIGLTSPQRDRLDGVERNRCRVRGSPEIRASGREMGALALAPGTCFTDTDCWQLEAMLDTRRGPPMVGWRGWRRSQSMEGGRMTTENGSRSTIRLSDGRRLGFAEWGDPAGKPVLDFRGLPSSRSGDAIDPAFLISHGIRRITVDRPGVGDSDFLSDRSLRDWPSDVGGLANQLHLGRFWLLGTSGGGPYVAACAYRMPDRIVRAAIVSGLGPLDRPGALDGMNELEKRIMLAARHQPLLALAAVGLATAADRVRPGTIYRGLVDALPPCDQTVARRPEVRKSIVDSYRRAFAHGTRGQVHDWAVIAAPWGFRADEIQVEVQLWHGDADDRVPLHHAEYLAGAIPQCELAILQGEGHMIAFSHIEEILMALTESGAEAATSRIQEPLPVGAASVLD
jgi:pimeloyl-ACP methyl ester carboxylesterase